MLLLPSHPNPAPAVIQRCCRRREHMDSRRTKPFLLPLTSKDLKKLLLKRVGRSSMCCWTLYGLEVHLHDIFGAFELTVRYSGYNNLVI